MKTFFKVLLSIVVLFFLVAACGVFYITRGLNTGSELGINGVDMSEINDGVYIGKYDSGRFSNKLEVTVIDNKITSINILKDVTFNKPEWTEQLFSRVIKNQNTDIDVISGATVTSKAYLKSIEYAVNNQGQN